MREREREKGWISSIHCTWSQSMENLQISSKLLTFVILFGISSWAFLYSVLIIKNILLENLYLKLFLLYSSFWNSSLAKSTSNSTAK